MKQDESSKERKEKRIMKKNNGLSKVFLGKRSEVLKAGYQDSRVH